MSKLKETVSGDIATADSIISFGKEDIVRKENLKLLNSLVTVESFKKLFRTELRKIVERKL